MPSCVLSCVLLQHVLLQHVLPCVLTSMLLQCCYMLCVVMGATRCHVFLCVLSWVLPGVCYQVRSPVHVGFMGCSSSLAQPCHCIPQRLSPVAVPHRLQATHVVPLSHRSFQLSFCPHSFCCLHPLLQRRRATLQSRGSEPDLLWAAVLGAENQGGAYSLVCKTT